MSSTAEAAESLAVRAGDGVHALGLGDGAQAILKCRRDAPEGFFAAEAEGLIELDSAGALRVPRVLVRTRRWILLDDLGRNTPDRSFWREAGAGLARLHSRRAACFGFRIDGFCGPTPQCNAELQDGHAFFAERRLRPQLALAAAGGRLDAPALACGERIVGRLADLLPGASAVLVHGDLWLGNLHCCSDGRPALIDAGAVHYGWAETDLAMLLLFGEPGAGFFDAYREHAPLAGDWRERAPLYNLYHLLNHLNLFGAAYHRQVLDVLHRFGQQ